jgi:uncharacterized membrane protein YczE
MTILTGLLGMGFETAYDTMPLTDVLLTICVVVGIYIVYVFRKLPIFNIIWMFLVAIFIYALLGYAGKKVKEWWKE